jgi:hypothetical protein
VSTTLKSGAVVEDRRLDRIFQPDKRNANYPIRTLLAGTKAPRSYTWAVKHWFDQGQEGRCVEFAICHELAARPAVVPVDSILEILDGRLIYWPAQREDYWPGGSYPGAEPQYEGTSVLAGMQVAKRLGFFKEFRWAFSLEDLVLAIGYKGPAVLGVNWYTGMFNTHADGFIKVQGSIGGGHAILAHSVKIVWKAGATTQTWADVDLNRSYIVLWNSWGPEWGTNGTAKISLTHMGRLLAEDGEAAIPVLRTLALAA